MSKKDDIMEPTFVVRDGMLADKEYIEWLADVKTRFRQSQIKASIRVNTDMLEFYWSIGRDLVALRAEERWGAGVVKQFALDMRQAFPDATGFSHTNVKYMKQWYSFYFKQITKSQQVVGPIYPQVGGEFGKKGKSHQLGDQLEQTVKSYQVGGQLEMPEIFGLVPWRHHVEIFAKSKSLNEALFYINKVVEGGWTRSWLEEQINAKLFEAQGAAITNFERTLPASQGILAKEMLKDPYHCEFLSLKERYNEHDLEDALVANVTQFLLELGKGSHTLADKWSCRCLVDKLSSPIWYFTTYRSIVTSSSSLRRLNTYPSLPVNSISMSRQLISCFVGRVTICLSA